MDDAVGGRAETSCSRVAVDRNGHHHIFLARLKSTGCSNAEMVSRFGAPRIPSAARIGQGFADETGIVWRASWISPRIGTQGREIWGKASLGIHRFVGDLGGVDGAHAAHGAGFIGGNARTQEIGNGDGCYNQSCAEVERAAAAGFANCRRLAVKPDKSR